MRELREVKGSDNFSNFPTLYKKDKERAKKQVLYVAFQIIGKYLLFIN